MTGNEPPLFVVVVTQEGQFTTPRAVGPFHDFDVAQAFAQTLLDRFESEGSEPLQVTVVRVEDAYPGVVVGEL